MKNLDQRRPPAGLSPSADKTAAILVFQPAPAGSPKNGGQWHGRDREAPREEPNELPVTVCSHRFRRCEACWVCGRYPAPDTFPDCKGTSKPHGRPDGSRVRIAQSEAEKTATAESAVLFLSDRAALSREARPCARFLKGLVFQRLNFWILPLARLLKRAVLAKHTDY